MRRVILLLAIAALSANAASAQFAANRNPKGWIDIQAVQHARLNKWSATGYVNDGLHGTSATEIRGVGNIYVYESMFGVFADLGFAVLPAPRMRSFDMGRMPMPNSGTRYYMREMVSESGVDKASVNVKGALGLFGDFAAMERLNVMPYFGVGFQGFPGRCYEMILKEEGSNNQYYAKYQWNRSGNDDTFFVLGHLTGRLNFRYELKERLNLLFGLEYTHYYDSASFYGQFSNTFNGNVRRSFRVRSDMMNTLGLSVGISFR